ncbi:hypothetical protein MGS_03507, partial [Candida albicans P78042]
KLVEDKIEADYKKYI